jgi:hypothetical protein
MMLAIHILLLAKRYQFAINYIAQVIILIANVLEPHNSWRWVLFRAISKKSQQTKGFYYQGIELII